MNKSESISELAKALAGFQKEVKQPKKDKTNPFFKSTYVDLAGVVDAITETAPNYGLSFMQHALTDENERVGVTTIILHETGEYIETPTIFAKPMKAGPQEVGSVITYLKRYSLSAAFGITSEVDDDGEIGMGRNNQQQPRQQQQQAPVNDNITQAQTKALRAKLNNIAHVNGQDIQTVYVSALKHFKLPEDTNSKALTKNQASDIISYLATLEPQKA